MSIIAGAPLVVAVVDRVGDGADQPVQAADLALRVGESVGQDVEPVALGPQGDQGHWLGRVAYWAPQARYSRIGHCGVHLLA